MALNREILNQQIKEVFGQLVSSKLLNIEFPVSGNTSAWANFFWGHPEECRENWAVPFVFMYDLTYPEFYDTICTDRMEVSCVFGIEATCEAIQANEDKFDNLWYKIHRVFGRNSGAWTITGTFTITNEDESVTTLTNPKLSDFGIRGANIQGNLKTRIDQGEKTEKIRYASTLNMTFYFNHKLIEFQ